MTEDEALFTAQALMNKLKDATDGSTAGTLRDRFNQRVLYDYETRGITSAEARINGLKVGTISVKVKKGKTEDSTEKFEVISDEALADWHNPKFDKYVQEWLKRNLAIVAEDYYYDTNDMPDGCEIVMREGRTIAPSVYTALSIEPDLVAEAYGTTLTDAIAGLLTGEVE